jgi:hypothetical protein
MKSTNKTLWVMLTAVSVALSACGGGSGSDGGAQGTNVAGWSATPDWVPNNSGNSGDSGNSDSSGSDNMNNPGTSPNSNTPSAPGNSVAIRIDTSSGGINMLTASITLCVPGAKSPVQCTTVDHMLVDTGSTGVRVMASAIKNINPLLLTQAGALDDKVYTASGAIDTSKSGAWPIAECMPFASGYTWGSVKRADVTLGTRTASNLPIQVIGDGAFNTPMDCINQGGASLNTAAALGANGILGISNFTADSKDALSVALPGNYYYCTSANQCISTRMSAAKEVTNPISAFAADNNGTVIRLPAVGATGKSGITGQLIFGVNSQANNALPVNPTITFLDAYGNFATQYKGTVFNRAAIDSGTNSYAFPDSTIATSNGWYVPSSALSLEATMEATDGSNAPLKMFIPIDNAVNLTASGNSAYNNVGSYFSSGHMFLWGLPFFYGRDIYTVIGNVKIGNKTGPFVAF